jgi:molybdate transport system substrate-binding protein
MTLGSCLAVLLTLEPGATTVGAAAQQTLTVYAAASLTEALTALGRAFEAGHPGWSVRFNFAGSQILATQIAQGARADVYVSADRRWMEFLGEKSLVDPPVIFARNRLVVVIPRSNPGMIRRVADLGRPGVKVVLAGAQVPAGAYSRLVLKQLAASPGFPTDFERRVLSNLVSEEENVRAVAAKVQLREADAGIVYRTDLGAPIASQVVRLDLPDCCNPIAEYPIAAVKEGQSELAQAFIALVLSEAGQKLLAERGFLGAEGAAR